MLGTKGRMTQVFDDKGLVTPATIVTAGPLTVTQVKAQDKDGYAAMQVGFGAKKESRVKKPQTAKPFKHLREFSPASEASNLQPGESIDISIFTAGDVVEVSAVSKGKGFQGVVKRHGFKGSPKSHGHKHDLRAPGSIGATFPEHVIKGKRMAGRMGGERTTALNLKIAAIDKENNVLFLKGAVPGVKGRIVEIVG